MIKRVVDGWLRLESKCMFMTHGCTCDEFRMQETMKTKNKNKNKRIGER